MSIVKRIKLLLKPLDTTGKFIVSCDASIKKNPGGPAAIGVVIRGDIPDQRKFHQVIARYTPAITNNEAEYDAVYEALGQIARLASSVFWFKEIEIHSDSQLVVRQLTGRYKVSGPQLAKRKDFILEKIREMHETPGFPEIKIIWYPRNSTEDLKAANNAAQDLLNVPNH